MNYANSEVQEKQQNGLLAAMFGDSRFKGLDKVHKEFTYSWGSVAPPIPIGR